MGVWAGETKEERTPWLRAITVPNYVGVVVGVAVWARGGVGAWACGWGRGEVGSAEGGADG